MALVLSCLIHAVAGRTFPAGERGSAAGSLLSSPTTLTILGPACCAGHHPSCPFTLSGSSVGQRCILRSIHLLSCTCNTSYVRILMLFNIFLHPSRSPASSCHMAHMARTTRVAPPPNDFAKNEMCAGLELSIVKDFYKRAGRSDGGPWKKCLTSPGLGPCF
jgi:hypothetical protein